MSAKAIEEALLEEVMEDSSPNNKRSRKGKSVTPLVDSVVRRSNRVKANSNGFKYDTYKIKNCLRCTSKPPTLSLVVLKKIGTSMCQMKEDQLEDLTLMAKKKMELVRKKPKKTNDDKMKEQEEKDDTN